MKIIKLTVENKNFIFNNEGSLISSTKNSVGKTTLLRILLYSLGYDVPSTKGLDFKKLDISLNIKNGDEVLTLHRSNNLLGIKEENINDFTYYDITVDRLIILKKIYKIDNQLILKNILAMHYFDQEKGWSLLNRGKVIGNIRFSIEEVIEGLANKDLSDLRNEKLDLSRKIKFYGELKKLLILKESAELPLDVDTNGFEEMSAEINGLKLQIAQATKEYDSLAKVKKSNERFVDFIEKNAIRVRTKTGETIEVNKESLVDFNLNEEILSTHLMLLKQKISDLTAKRQILIKDFNKKNTMVDVEAEISRLSKSILDVNVSSDVVEQIRKETQKNKKIINKKIKDILNGTDIINEIYNYITEFSNEVGIKNLLDKTPNFVFTNNLKRYSGANLHLLALIFRLALLKKVQSNYHMTVPLIIDSPLTGELDEENLNKMFRLIEKHFPENQLIVATIYGETIRKVTNLNSEIKIHNQLLE